LYFSYSILFASIAVGKGSFGEVRLCKPKSSVGDATLVMKQINMGSMSPEETEACSHEVCLPIFRVHPFAALLQSLSFSRRSKSLRSCSIPILFGTINRSFTPVRFASLWSIAAAVTFSIACKRSARSVSPWKKMCVARLEYLDFVHVS
jgi:hypothetical protein